MNKPDLTINPKEETERIVSFIKQTFAEHKMQNVVLGLSGGVDSATSFKLLLASFNPQQIYVLHMYYEKPMTENFVSMLEEAQIPEANIINVSIKEVVESIARTLAMEDDELKDIRIGNISARVRMIMLFDYAKKYSALVCGTENKSEHYLGYFTRFGDQASDIEPLEHLYKTQIYQLAKHLGVPEVILEQAPSAGLWQGQTDEEEFGFDYDEADQVLALAVDQKQSPEEIKKLGFVNVDKIIKRREENLFKYQTPYLLPKK